MKAYCMVSFSFIVIIIANYKNLTFSRFNLGSIYNEIMNRCVRVEKKVLEQVFCAL